MPELLIEFFSEEIPARMQKRAEEDAARLLGEKLKGAGLEPKKIETFSGPRRLTLLIPELPASTPDVREERKGPRVGAPEKAIEGFLKSAGLASIDQAKVQTDPKGDFYVALIEKKGADTAACLSEIIPEIVRAFPWPKSMRSRDYDLQWVRPLHNIAVVFGGKHVKVALPGVKSEPITWGHRFHSKGAIEIQNFAQYQEALLAAHVLLDREARKTIILDGARAACVARNLELVEDAGLLEEVAGLAEWPVVLMGDMNPDFLDLPGEVIRLSMRTHQKYFAVRDPKTGKLAPHFVVVASIAAKDGGAAIAKGNARVLSARLNDARYFWDVDRFYDPIEKTKPKKLDADERIEKLKQIVFHQKLGSVWDKVERVSALAVELCSVTGADPDLVKRAARLMKCDLVTETVGEFPEVQGQIGRALYLQSLDAPPPREGRGQGVGRNDTPAGTPRPPTPSPRGEGESVAIAIEDHYRPLGPNDRVPSDPVAITLALADKLDTLVGFWAIDEKPTGSSDAYGLRRAALGFVRIVLTNGIRFSAPRDGEERARAELSAKPSPLAGRGREGGGGAALAEPSSNTPTPGPSPQGGGESGFDFRHVILFAAEKVLHQRGFSNTLQMRNYSFRDLVFGTVDEAELRWRLNGALASEDAESVLQLCRGQNSLLAFLADRLKVQLRDQGKRHDLVDAVFALGDDDLVRIVARVEALDEFLKTEDGANLLAGYKRAANILRAEEKKNADLSTLLQKHEFDAAQLVEAEEKSLHDTLERAREAAKNAVASEQFADAMRALAQLRAPVDKFFDKVLVNAPEENLRLNRLKLLTRMRDALHEVADFSKIEG